MTFSERQEGVCPTSVDTSPISILDASEDRLKYLAMSPTERQSAHSSLLEYTFSKAGGSSKPLTSSPETNYREALYTTNIT